MARFLEIDNTATTEGIAGIHYLNMDLIDTPNPNAKKIV